MSTTILKYKKDNIVTKKVKLNILIIDENDKTLELFKNVLEYRGHNVIIINEGIRSVTSIMNNKIDLIFMNYTINNLNQINLIDLIRESLKCDLMIILYCYNNKVNNINNKGLYGTVIKPIDYKTINEIINIFENVKHNDKKYLLNNSNTNSFIIFNYKYN